MTGRAGRAAEPVVDRPVEPVYEPTPLPVPEGIAARIAATVESWEGATSHVYQFGDVEFRAGDCKLGYLHGDSVADLLVPKDVHDQAIATGVAHPHHVLPESNWVNVHIHQPEHMHEVIALLRSAYEWAVRRPIQSPVTE